MAATGLGGLRGIDDVGIGTCPTAVEEVVEGEWGIMIEARDARAVGLAGMGVVPASVRPLSAEERRHRDSEERLRARRGGGHGVAGPESAWVPSTDLARSASVPGMSLAVARVGAVEPSSLSKSKISPS